MNAINNYGGIGQKLRISFINLLNAKMDCLLKRIIGKYCSYYNQFKNEDFFPNIVIHSNRSIITDGIFDDTLLDIIKLLIKEKWFNINYQDPRTGMTLLMQEALYGNIKSVAALLYYGAKSNIEDNNQRTFLDYAKVGVHLAKKGCNKLFTNTGEHLFRKHVYKVLSANGYLCRECIYKVLRPKEWEEGCLKILATYAKSPYNH